MCCSVTMGKMNCFNLTSVSWWGLKTPERWGFLLNKGSTGITGSNSISVKRISVEFTTVVGVVLHNSNVRCSLSSADREYLRSAINDNWSLHVWYHLFRHWIINWIYSNEFRHTNQIKSVISTPISKSVMQCSYSPLDWHCQVTLIKPGAINVFCTPLCTYCTAPAPAAPSHRCLYWHISHYAVAVSGVLCDPNQERCIVVLVLSILHSNDNPWLELFCELSPCPLNLLPLSGDPSSPLRGSL